MFTFQCEAHDMCCIPKMHHGEESKFYLALRDDTLLFTARPAASWQPRGSVGTEERPIRQMGKGWDVPPVGLSLEIVEIGSCSAAATQSLRVQIPLCVCVCVCVCE